jgi:hypothetical protein
MTKAQRLKFMRKRFGRPKGLFAAKPRPQDSAKGSYRFDAFGVPQHLSELRQKRVYLPDPKPAICVAIKRTARKSALTRIAEQLPAKLPRVLFYP